MDPLGSDRIEEIEAVEVAKWAEAAPYVADFFTERELRLMLNCIEYRDGDPGGLPGHNLMILVAKLLGSLGWTTEKVYELMDMKAAAGGSSG